MTWVFLSGSSRQQISSLDSRDHSIIFKKNFCLEKLKYFRLTKYRSAVVSAWCTALTCMWRHVIMSCYPGDTNLSTYITHINTSCTRSGLLFHVLLSPRRQPSGDGDFRWVTEPAFKGAPHKLINNGGPWAKTRQAQWRMLIKFAQRVWVYDKTPLDDCW